MQRNASCRVVRRSLAAALVLLLTGCGGGGETSSELRAGFAEGYAQASAPKTLVMDESERVAAVGVEVIAAKPVADAKPPRWLVSARITNSTDVALEGVEVMATLLPPGTVAPLAMHAREILFEPALAIGKERVVELDFPVAPSKVAAEDIRKEVKVARIVRYPVSMPSAWKPLDEATMTLDRTEGVTTPLVDEKAELAKLMEARKKAGDEAPTGGAKPAAITPKDGGA